MLDSGKSLFVRRTVYDNGTLAELQEEYDARALHGVGVGVNVWVARTVQVIPKPSDVFYGPYPFNLVNAGHRGTSEEKEVWISARSRRVLSKAIMGVVVSAENSFPLPGAGYGWDYSLSLVQ